MSNNNTQILEAQFSNLSVNDNDNSNNTAMDSHNNTNNAPVVVVGDDVQSLQRSKYNITNAYSTVPEDFNLIKECSSFHPLENMYAESVQPYSMDLSNSQDDLQTVKQKNNDHDVDVLLNNLNLSPNLAITRQRSMPYCM